MDQVPDRVVEADDRRKHHRSRDRKRGQHERQRERLDQPLAEVEPDAAVLTVGHRVVVKLLAVLSVVLDGVAREDPLPCPEVPEEGEPRRFVHQAAVHLVLHDRHHHHHHHEPADDGGDLRQDWVHGLGSGWRRFDIDAADQAGPQCGVYSRLAETGLGQKRG
jgi:hypothetical protein